jgi:hypothetical protein
MLDLREGESRRGLRHPMGWRWTMPRLTIWQVLIGILVGAIFASLQGEPPVPALSRLAITCPIPRVGSC